MRKAFIVLFLILSVSGWLACNKGNEANQAEGQQTQVDAEAVAQAMTQVTDLKAKFDAAETQEDRDAAMNELSSQLQTVLSLDPNHAEANAMMDDAQLYYAEQWVKQGKYAKALEIVNNVLAFSPNNAAAQEKKALYEDWQDTTKEEFDLVKKNMYMEEVTELIGYPRQKTEKADKYGQTVYGWIYKEPELQQAVTVWFNANGQVYSTSWPKK